MKKSVCLVALCAAFPVNAQTLDPFDSLYVFGDSLSDSGNLAIASPEFVPNPPYPNGQFTNGDTWATQLGLTPSLAGGTNFAFGGARATDNSPADAIPDLLSQIAAFTATGGARGAAPLAVIWAGGNDFLDFAQIADPTDQDVGDLISGVSGSINTGVQQLVASGVSDVVLVGQPSFGILPQFSNDPVGAAQATGASVLLNSAIEGTAAALNGALPGADVSFFDLDTILAEVLAGLPADTAQVSCLEALAECTANPENFLFFDDIHPVEGVHSILADAFADAVIQPVPIPASGMLILTGLAGLGLWGRRRKSLA